MRHALEGSVNPVNKDRRSRLAKDIVFSMLYSCHNLCTYAGKLPLLRFGYTSPVIEFSGSGIFTLTPDVTAIVVQSVIEQ